jgi:hypothetical protein
LWGQMPLPVAWLEQVKTSVRRIPCERMWSYSPNWPQSEKLVNERKGNLAAEQEENKATCTIHRAELGEVDSAVADSGALSRRLFISEAIHAVLQHFDKTKVEGKRNRRIDASISTESREAVEQLDETLELTQQSVLRSYILRHVRAAHRKHPPVVASRTGEDEAH